MGATVLLGGGTVEHLTVSNPTSGFAPLAQGDELTVVECTTSNVVTAARADGDVTLRLDSCRFGADSAGVVAAPDGSDYPTVYGHDTDVYAPSPAWNIEGVDDRLSGCSGVGLSLESTRAVVTDHRVYGSCETYGLRLAGSNNLVSGGMIACSTGVGLWVDDARCSRVTGVSIIAGSDDNSVNCSEWAVKVTGTNTDPETMLDGIDICGPGVYQVTTYGCTSGDFDCAGQPCGDCLPGPECDDPEVTVDNPCTDPLCWPPVEERLPQLFSYCLSPAGLWNVEVPIKTTRHATLTFRELTAGQTSNLWRPGSIDCATEAVLHVWTDDYGLAAGDTEVILFDDTSGSSWTLTCPSTDAVAVVPVNLELHPDGPTYLTSQLRAEIVSVTVPNTAVEVSVTVRLP